MSKPNGSKKKPIEDLGELAHRALVSANAKLVVRSRETGRSLVIWRDGKVCHVPASEIEIPTYPEEGIS
jgi:hypothetical protein